MDTPAHITNHVFSHSLLCYQNNVACIGIVRVIYADYLFSLENEIIGFIYIFLMDNNYSNNIISYIK